MVWPVVLAGCNGDNSSGGPIFGATPTPTTAVSQLAGTYTGNFTGGANGTLRLVINNNGTITGTLDSPNLRSAASTAIVPMAVFTGSGTLGNDGNFQIPFRVGTQTVTFRGRLTRQGSNVIAQNLTWSSTSGQSGSFTLQLIVGNPGATATPVSTATPGGSATPTPTTGGGTGACTTGTGNATFSSASSSVTSTAFRNVCANGALSFANGRPVQIVVALGDAQGGKARALTFAANDFTNGIAAGRSYTVSPSNLATYTETVPGSNRITQWMGTGGTLRVTSLQGTNASVTFTNVRFGPGRAAGNITSGTGTFTINGSANVQLRRQ
ncbi:MAG: hypothetical protein JWN98_1933 [Abditibacteriota bacterium]|nr:hypothetical protein [Abditibacteriota bacterium]